MDIIISIVFGVLLGLFISGVISKYKKLVALRELDNTINEKLSSLREKIIPSRIEEDNGILFLYNDETNEFLGQGNTFEELESNVRLKYPNKLFNVPQSDLNKYLKD